MYVFFRMFPTNQEFCIQKIQMKFQANLTNIFEEYLANFQTKINSDEKQNFT